MFLCFVLLGVEVQGQCSFGGTNSGVVVTPTALPQPTTNIQAGNYFLMNVITGGTYTVRTCGLTAWDTQLTVYNSTGGSSIAYNDDACGSLRSQTSFTATFTGQVRVILNQWSCTSSSNTSQVEYFGTIPGPELTITDVSENEDDGTILFTVTHVNAAASGGFTVNYQTVDVSTTAGSDYTAIPSGVLNFDGTLGDTDQIIVSILDDLTFEGNEIFEIQFTGTSDASVDRSAVGEGTIIDDESDPNATRPYEERAARNLMGNFKMRGNTNLQCVSGCPTTPTTNNPGVNMAYIDVDADGTTVNSSSSNFSIPVGANVEWAGLYWGGMYNSSNSGITNPPGTLNIDQVKFREPGAGTYTIINAEVRNIETVRFSGWRSFMSHADVTTIVQNAGSGNYFVADIALATGRSFTGPYGGWTMVIVYNDPTEKTRRINVWDGFNIFRGGTDNFTVTGLLTPSSGAFETHSGYFGMDGEANQTGDFVSINGTQLTNGLNPNNNTLNGTISEFGIDVGGRNPNFAYSWGIDSDVFDASGTVGTGATNLSVSLGSTSDGIWGGVFVVSNEIAFPSVASKIFTPDTVYVGDESTVTLVIDNPANGVTLTNFALTDGLPAGMTISNTPDAASTCGGTITATGGASSFTVSGVNIPAGSSCTFTFDIVTSAEGTYTNTISPADVSNTQNIPISGESSGVLTVLPLPDNDNDGIPDVTDLDDDNDGIPDSDELSTIISNSQNDCTGETTLDFSAAATLVSGTALTQGAVYRIPNIIAGTDALVTIIRTNNASVANIDNNSSDASAFRPQTAFTLANPGDRGYIEYNIQFVNSGGTTPVVITKFFANFNDIDGNSNYAEQLWSDNPTSYIISNPTELTMSTDDSWVIGTAGTNEFAGAGNGNPEVNFGTVYNSQSSISVRVGGEARIAGASASGRQHNIEFSCLTNYVSPETYGIDIDSDGIANHLDLDSDNDGIYDAVEVGHDRPHTLGIVNGSYGSNGLADIVETAVESGTINYSIANTDGTTASNYLDTDSDDDGCGDANEAYADPNADGGDNEYFALGSPPTTDSDGRVTAAAYPVPADSDSNGTQDYKETESAPVITTQPVNGAACPNGDTTFSVVASNIDTYQWQIFSGGSWVDLSNSGIHGGTDSATLTITNAQISDDGNLYRVIVSNSSYICDTETSNQVTLTVAEPIVNAGTNQTICDGDSVTLMASTSGGTPGYNYLWNTGQTTASITFTPTGDPNANTFINYTVTVTDQNGCQDTDTVRVTIESSPTATVSKIDASCGLDNGQVIFNFPDHPNRTGIEFSLDNQATYESNVPDASGSVTYSDLATGSYDLWVRWGNNECPVNLGSHLISNVPQVVISTQPANQTVFVNDNATFSVSTSNTDTYQWQVSTNGGGSFANIVDGTEYSGTQTASLTVNTVEQTKNGYLYRVLVSNSTTSCPPITSNIALLAVNVKTVITNRRITYRVIKN